MIFHLSMILWAKHELSLSIEGNSWRRKVDEREKEGEREMFEYPTKSLLSNQELVSIRKVIVNHETEAN
jgi:hypothetical protein